MVFYRGFTNACLLFGRVDECLECYIQIYMTWCCFIMAGLPTPACCLTVSMSVWSGNMAAPTSPRATSDCCVWSTISTCHRSVSVGERERGSSVLTVLFGCYIAGATRNCCHPGACFVYSTQPCTISHHFMQSHRCRVHVCLAVCCHLHFWQNDQDLLYATAMGGGGEGLGWGVEQIPK